MQSINYSKDYFINYLSKHKLNPNGYNSESVIYVDRKKLVKIFEPHIDKDDKFETINKLDKRRKTLTINTPEIILPNSIVNIDNEFVGYTMKYYAGKTLDEYLNDENVSFKDKKDALVKLGVLLEKMNELRKNNDLFWDFYLNDLHGSNVFVTHDKKIKIMDTDSIKVDGNKKYPSMYLDQMFAINRKYLQKKYRAEGNRIYPSRNSDLYCYIQMIMKWLVGFDVSYKDPTSYYYYVKKLEDNGLNQKLGLILSNIYEEVDNENPYKLLENQRSLSK